MVDIENEKGVDTMGISLKKEEMIEYLERMKVQGENFRCMLWGTVYAKPSSFSNHSKFTVGMADPDSALPGLVGSLNNAFCYIGITEKSLYVVAVDTYDTSRITGTFALPFANITSLNTRKNLGSSTVEIESGDFVSLTVKSTSIGTNIKDQKERMAEFLAAMELLKGGIR